MTQYPLPGSPAEMLARAELRAKLDVYARDLWSESLDRLVHEARLLLLLGHPFPRDPVTRAALLPNAQDEREEPTDPK